MAIHRHAPFFAGFRQIGRHHRRLLEHALDVVPDATQPGSSIGGDLFEDLHVRERRWPGHPIGDEPVLLLIVAGFLTTLYATLLIAIRTSASRAEEQSLSWGERAGRANSRFGRVFVADEFRWLRRLWIGAWLATIGSAGLGLLLHAQL